MKRKKYNKWIYIVAFLLAITFILLFFATRSKSSDDLGKVERGNILEGVYGIGTVTAKQSYELKVGVTSIIAELYVQEGDFVSKGQKLLRLESGTVFQAPFSGTITSLPNQVGEAIYPQQSLLTLTDLMQRYLVVSLEQQAAIRVIAGQKARLSFDSLRDQVFEGEVEAVYSHGTNYLVRIKTDDLPPQILPGMTVDVAIAIHEHKQVLLIPVAGLNAGQVMIKRQGKKHKVTVGVGTVDGSLAEITTGNIQEGDLILPWGK